MWLNAIGSIIKFRHAPCLHDHVTGHVVRFEYKYPALSLFQSRCLHLTDLFPRGETHFRFALIIIQEFDPNSKNILRQFQNLSLPNFFIASSNYSKTISKPVLAANFALQSQPTHSWFFAK